jgi:hypothetical protein
MGTFLMWSRGDIFIVVQQKKMRERPDVKDLGFFVASINSWRDARFSLT